MREERIPVLIAGGSLVGLSTAMFLAWHGIPALVVERHPGTAIHPRAAMFNQRTLELYRSVGIESEILDRANAEFLQDGAIVAVETLAGRELASFLPTLNHGVLDVSPCRRVYCTQNVLEPILRRRAEALGARTRFNVEVSTFETDDDGVRAIVRDRADGSELLVRARYLIGADGNRSPVRERLGIPMTGRGSFSNSATIYFRADIRQPLRERPFSVIYVNNARLRGFMRFDTSGQSGFLAVNAMFGPDGKVNDVAAEVDDARCVQLVRDAIGVPGLDVEIVIVQPWRAAADVAERFRKGPAFLAGDAAHTMPPTGGFGGNTGVQDANNLAWKLALVLDGVAGSQLLDTYEMERQPAAHFAAEQAYTRYVKRTDPSLGNHDLQAQEDDLCIELGECYQSPAVCPSGQGQRPGHVHPREANALPGTRAPHLLLVRDGREISTLDLFGKNFVLLAGSRDTGWCQAARDAAADCHLPLDAWHIGADLGDPAGRFAECYGTSMDGAVLIRPDGFVAWRAQSPPESRRGTLETALTHLLCRWTGPQRAIAAA